LRQLANWPIEKTTKTHFGLSFSQSKLSFWKSSRFVCFCQMFRAKSQLFFGQFEPNSALSNSSQDTVKHSLQSSGPEQWPPLASTCLIELLPAANLCRPLSHQGKATLAQIALEIGRRRPLNLIDVQSALRTSSSRGSLQFHNLKRTSCS